MTTTPDNLFAVEAERIRQSAPLVVQGRVNQVVGLVVKCRHFNAPVGALCEIVPAGRGEPVEAEVIGFDDEETLVMPLGPMRGIGRGDLVASLTTRQQVAVGPGMLGRVLDGRGRPADGEGPLLTTTARPVYGPAPDPLERRRLTDPLSVGVRAIDGLLTLAKGQRVGIFSGSGVGKSTLLGMIARNTSADVNVIALVGERGREVKDFIERDLGEEGLKRSVVVVATSDRPNLMRVHAAFTATAVAEYFRDRGADVLLMMDSITRLSMAQREIGLSAGEPPTTRGYTPSVFAMMPRLLERAGRTERGSITGIYNVLVEGDDVNEPIADTARGILDGHIWLSRDLADRGQYPAIDALTSVSRLMNDVADDEHKRGARMVSRVLATYRDAEDLINVGAYSPGANPEIDLAVRTIAPVREFLMQGVFEQSPYEETVKRLKALAAEAERPAPAQAG
jgi:flagellum-specific ATP synthase